MKATPKGTVLSSSVKNVGSGIEVRAVEAEEVARFESLLCERHYLGEAKPVGDFLRQVALRDGEWVRLAVWGPGCLQPQGRRARDGLECAAAARTAQACGTEPPFSTFEP